MIGAELRRTGIGSGARVLDATCGIGTQALPLALAGYDVTGTDLSGRAIERARTEAESRGITATFAVSDVRAVRDAIGGTFDAVVSCDNALPHLPTQEDLVAAVGAIRLCLRPGGIFLATMRDYDRLATLRPRGEVPVLYGSHGNHRIVGQAWEWADDAASVRIRLFVLREGTSGWTVDVWSTMYRALTRSAMEDALRRGGFPDQAWREPAVTGYYQPIVIAVAT